MKRLIGSVLGLAVPALVVVSFIEAVRGNPIFFRGLFFAGFVGSVLSAAYVGDILASLQNDHNALLIARARVEGKGIEPGREIKDAGRRASANVVRVLALIGAALAFVFALRGVPAIPAGTLVAILICLPFTGAPLLFSLSAWISLRGLRRISGKVAQVERLHEAVRTLVGHVEAAAGERAGIGVGLVLFVITSAAGDVARRADVASLEFSVGDVSEEEWPENVSLPLLTSKLTTELDHQPIERAQAWVDQLLPAADRFAAAALAGEAFSFKLIVDPD
jgi:hypothetical protein